MLQFRNLGISEHFLKYLCNDTINININVEAKFLYLIPYISKANVNFFRNE